MLIRFGKSCQSTSDEISQISNLVRWNVLQGDPTPRRIMQINNSRNGSARRRHPGQGSAGRTRAESYRSAILARRARGFMTLARTRLTCVGGRARRERHGFVLRGLGGARWAILHT
jgi:hypothetical protein